MNPSELEYWSMAAAEVINELYDRLGELPVGMTSYSPNSLRLLIQEHARIVRTHADWQNQRANQLQKELHTSFGGRFNER